MCRLLYLTLLVPICIGCDSKPTYPTSNPVPSNLQLGGGNGTVPPNGGTTPQVGKAALAVEGKDLDGKPLKLSDYRGKVVMLDFWATWCPPCRAMIPHEKELVNRMQGRPFVLLGVSLDHTPQELKSYMANEKINWPNIYDAGGPIGKAWGVQGIPTVYLIDTKGVIRFTHVGANNAIDAEVEQTRH